MKTKLLALLFLAVSLNSCTTDDSENLPITEANLVGSWSLESHTMNGKPMNNFKDRFTFTADHKVTLIEANYQSKCSGTYTLTGADLKCVFTIGEKFTYRLHIKSLTPDRLNWETKVAGEGMLNEIYRK